jgi:hypothetical protein
MARGLCRTKAAKTGAETARVEYGAAGPSTVPRSLYERHHYEPPFEELPLCEEFDAQGT